MLKIKRNMLDTIGLSILFFALITNPFHFVLVNEKEFIYYREEMAILFAILSIMKYWFDRSRGLYESLIIRKELFFFLLFPVLLVIFNLGDPGKSLYVGNDAASISMQLNGSNFGLYVLRNALLYVPMVVYIGLRGLSELEIRKIALISITVAPFSILSYLSQEHLATFSTLSVLAGLGGEGIAYNSYVPYLTFPIMSAIYLCTSDSNKFIKIFSIVSLLFIFIFILLSTSRQSVLFSVGCGIVFFVLNKQDNFIKKWLFLFGTLLAGIFIFQQLTTGEVLNERFVERFGSTRGLTETSRVEIAKNGLGLLEPEEYFIGAGLTSVIVSGPHNDFIRWTQRVGIFVMLLGFSPFIIAAKKSYRSILRGNNQRIMIFIFLSIQFTLFHSLFGYPREDAYQSLYCFLGLALWLGYDKYNARVVSM